MQKFRYLILLTTFFLLPASAQEEIKSTNRSLTNPPIYIAFLWHMHQPIYWPYETVVQTDQNSRYSYSVVDIHNSRYGPYTSWPKDAVLKGVNAGFGHFGAQVSFSGSLIENLNNLESAGNGNFQNWKSNWNSIKTQTTSLGNPRIDMVGFGYHHPLMGLIDYTDIRKQIQAHKQMFSSNFSGSYSKGIFPPENAFSEREIPALVDEGIEWVLVDNIHFDRACSGYSYSTSGNLVEPNSADIRNFNPNDWVSLTGLWAPTKNSARWGRQPHYARYIDPATGTIKKMIVVPCDRYMGNEDGRGGFGALSYDAVMSQLESYNTDPNHPILIVLHHDGDNYGGGTDSYYGSNFQSFVDWLGSNTSRFVCTTVQDYLEMYPPDTSDIIHVEDGSWSGADNGDPEFKKWNGDPYNGYSPDRNSWGVITATKNFILTAEQINPSSTNTQNAWKYFLNGEASDYWYWDGSQNGVWDSHPTRASNLAIPYAQSVISGGTDLTPPTIYLPQREPLNPGGTEWTITQPSDFTVWTYVFDVSGLKSVTLKYRTSTNTTVQSANETYTGGTGAGTWNGIPMTGVSITPQTSPLPLFKAKEYSAQITGYNTVLIDYYVEAIDSNNNIASSPIAHVWVGTSSGGGGGGTSGVSWVPTAPTKDSTITITVGGVTQGGKLHWGINNSGSSWAQPDSVYWPGGSSLFNGTGPAVQSTMAGPDSIGNLTITIGPFNKPKQAVQTIAFVIHYNDDTWDNNSGGDYHITIAGADTSDTSVTYTMDGNVDASAQLLTSNDSLSLYAGWNGSLLYVATKAASSVGGDVFILISDSLRTARSAMWGKSGTVAAWSAYIGNESTNNWRGWFNKTEGTVTNGVQSAAGSYVEGTINLASYFGQIPETLYLAVAKYQTADGGSLLRQLPTGNGDANIDASELYKFSYTFVVQPPVTPVLTSPANNALNQPVAITLSWNSVQNATSYHLQLSSDSTFASGLMIDDSSLVSTSRSVGGLTHSTTYYWRVRAKNSGGTSIFSSVRSFTTVIAAPGAPVLFFPSDGSDSLISPVIIRWFNSATAVTYRLQVTRDSSFTTIVINDSTLSDTLRTCTLIAGKHWWRVNAKNVGGNSPYSPIRSFTIVVPLPPMPILIYPADSADSVASPVALRWYRSATATAYRLQLSQDSAFSSIVFDDSTLTDTVRSCTLPSGVYYWHVKAKNDGGSTPYSPCRHFTVPSSPFVSHEMTMMTGWNLISIPIAIPSTRKDSIFPSAISDAFYFNGSGYIAADSLLSFTGYWLKFDSSRIFEIQGIPFTQDSVNVKSGWNLIGISSEPIPVDSITTIPVGILKSNFFRYNGAYSVDTILTPGNGYWIRVDQDGTIFFNR
jgi:hypothetical protein